MQSLRRFALPLAALFPAILLFAGIGSFGIWDPWELNVAEGGDGAEEVVRAPTLTAAAIRLSFSLFGVSETAGRAPLALAACLLLGAGFAMAWRRDSPRAGAYAGLILATAPIVLLNGRGMFGDAFAMAANGLVGLFATGLAFGLDGSAEEKTSAGSARRLVIGVVGLGLSVAFAFAAAGGLSGVMPPLVACAVVAALRFPHLRGRMARMGSLVVVAAGGLVAAGVTWAVVRDGASYSAWLGGAPFGGEPPTFDAGLERVFHGFGPWAGLMVIALARLLAPLGAEDASDETKESAKRTDGDFYFRLTLLLWAALGYVALMLYTARYGESTFHSVAPVGVAIALLLRDLERSQRSWWGEAVVASLFVVLILRDYALFPATSIDSLPIQDLTTPEIFNPRRDWAKVLLLFVAAQALVFCGGPEWDKQPDLKAPYRFLKERWNEGVAPQAKRTGLGRFLGFFKNITVNRGWLLLAGLLMIALLAFGGLCWAIPDAATSGEYINLTSIAIRAGKKLFFVPFAIPLLILGGQVALYVSAKLGAFRIAPLLVAGVLVGAYVSLDFLPALSTHFSPRAVYEVYNAHHVDGEELGEYRVSGRASAYYTDGAARELENQAALLDFLLEDTRHWAVIPADQLPTVNRAFRTRSGRHLFVADAENARLNLVTGQDVEGLENQSFIAQNVLDEAPTPQFPVGTNFDNKIELVGYDLEAPQEGYVGAGQQFAITWYWRALTRIPGSYQLFLHVDGHGNRLNGDHEPVDGRYPVRLWEEGDVIVDRQELTMPANYRPGDYTLWIGFFSGNTRLPITEGNKDNANRANAGTVTVR